MVLLLHYFVAFCLLISPAFCVSSGHACYLFESCANETAEKAFAFLYSNRSVEEVLDEDCQQLSMLCPKGNCYDERILKRGRIYRYMERVICRSDNREVIERIAEESACYRNEPKLLEVAQNDLTCLNMISNNQTNIYTWPYVEQCSQVLSARDCSINHARTSCGNDFGWLAGIMANAFANHYFKDCVTEGLIDTNINFLLGSD